MSRLSSRSITLSDARSLASLFQQFPPEVARRLQLGYHHDEELELCVDLWRHADPSVHYLIYLTLDTNTRLAIERQYRPLLPSADTDEEP